MLRLPDDILIRDALFSGDRASARFWAKAAANDPETECRVIERAGCCFVELYVDGYFVGYM